VTDEDAQAVGVAGHSHRAFLADFYAGNFAGGFARGGYFQSNPETGDRRSTGTCASLCGLEAALASNDAPAIDAAIHRILMGHALIASFGGIPLLYMGDELGLLNDHGYEADPHLKHDERWMHRPLMDWAKAARRNDPETVEGRIFSGLRHIIGRRRATTHLHARNPTEIVDLGVDGVFAFARRSPIGSLVCVYNFADAWRLLDGTVLANSGASHWFDMLGNAEVQLSGGHLRFPPQGRIWLI
jgi:amylosucrase